MTRRLVLLLSITLASASRLLDSRDEQQEWQDYDDQDEDEDRTWIDRVFDRIEDDMLDMWASSPDSWTSEYWKVFGVLLACVLFAVLFILLICCVPCCCFEDNSQPTTVTQEQFDKAQAEKTQALLNDDDKDDTESQLSPVGMIPPPSMPNTADSPRSPSSFSNPLGRFTFGSGTVTSNTTGAPVAEESEATLSPKRVRKKRRSLWSEVVSVWSEFLFGDIDEEEKRDRQRDYKKFMEESGATSPRSGSKKKTKKGARRDRELIELEAARERQIQMRQIV